MRRLLARMQRRFAGKRNYAVGQELKSAPGRTQQGGDAEIGRGFTEVGDQMTKHDVLALE